MAKSITLTAVKTGYNDIVFALEPGTSISVYGNKLINRVDGKGIEVLSKFPNDNYTMANQEYLFAEDGEMFILYINE